MGQVKKPQRVKLVIAMLAKDKKLFDQIEEFFIKEFGDIDFRSPTLLFDHTSYYKKEMGHPLNRRFLSFRKVILPGRIAAIKIITNSIEKRFSVLKKGSLNRQINIDPGYISDSKFILTTTKDYFHRIYLKNGIFAELTLVWRKGSFHPFDWTYPDYKTPEYIRTLNEIRNGYMKGRK